jgi:FtsP/CotA-like multicopper oxidase with cupredoxin domain
MQVFRATKWLLLVGVPWLGSCAAHGSEPGEPGGALGKADDPHAMHHDSHAGMPPAPALLAHPAWNAEGALDGTLAADLDPDAATVEVDLVADEASVEVLPGVTSEVWAYNGSLPGPRIEAKVGDHIVVHLTNNLAVTTSVHWHGVRVPNDMDGMTAVAPGTTFTYEFDALEPGVYWYHPHYTTSVQVDRGLHGALIVRDVAEPALPVVSERVLVLDDTLIDAATGVVDTTSTDARVAMMGREGNLLLVNGRPANGGLAVHAGEWHRLRLVNAANSRYFRLSVSGGALVQLGSETGGLEAPVALTEILLVPGDRADVLVSVDAPNTEAALVATPYERAVGAGATAEATLLRFVADEAAVPREALPTTWRTFAAPAAAVGVRGINFSEVMDGTTVQFLVNGATYPNGPTALATEGTVERWRIMNHSGMDHPFHVHGFFFSPVGTREWHDTLNIRPHRAVDVDVAFASRPGVRGTWMYHCHILEHGDSGMMAEVEVGDTTGWRAAPAAESDAGAEPADAGTGSGGHNHH